MPFSVRLDPATLARLKKLAASGGVSKSVILREAVEHYAVEAERRQAESPTALDRLRPYVGTVDTGGGQFSTDTHTKYLTALRRRRDAARPRRRQRADRSAR